MAHSRIEALAVELGGTYRRDQEQPGFAECRFERCSNVEYERFSALNDAYKEKFGFPFVMAVRDSSCKEILEVFSRRLQNDYDEEFETALAEIHEIARLRLQAMESGA